jgi:hypothetical protein
MDLGLQTSLVTWLPYVLVTDVYILLRVSMNFYGHNIRVEKHGLYESLTNAAVMRKVNTQTATDDAWTKVTFTAEVFDKDGSIVDLTNERLHCLTAGIYLVNTHGGVLSDSSAGDQRHHSVRRYNSSDVLQEERIMSKALNNSNNRYWSSSAVFQCDANDYIEYWYFHNTGSDDTIGTTTASYLHVQPHMRLVKLSNN